MIIKIVGVQEQDYKMDNGYAFKGRKLHVIDCDTQTTGLTGNLVTTLKIPDSSGMASVPLSLGKKYVCYFNQKGGLDYFAPYEEK